MRLLRKTGPLSICMLMLGATIGRPDGKGESVGYLLAVMGQARLARKGSAPVPAYHRAPVCAGDVLRLVSGARVSFFCQPGALWRLTGPAAIAFDASGIHKLSGNAPVLRARLNVSISLPTEMSAKGATHVTRQKNPTAGPSHPRPIGGVTEPRCVLRWDLPPALANARLTLRIVLDETPLLTRDLPPGTREFEIPEGLCPTGRWLKWSVSLVGTGTAKGSCIADLRLLAPAERADLEHLREQVAALVKQDPADAGPDLLLASTCDRLGLWQEALKAYQRAPGCAANPQVRRKISHLRDLLGRP